MASQSGVAMDGIIAFSAAAYANISVAQVLKRDPERHTHRAFLPPAAFAGLRVYALTRRRWLSALVFLLSSTSFATNMVWRHWFPLVHGHANGFKVFFGFDLSAGTQVPMMGCEEHATIPPSLVQMYANS
ncbi:hypothetical protein LXA43DRAFT_1063470 [Ganoderma leucocontextum]|nr:hypothetical protein LXA43DRAFT_1063470 [Ganoderma leucocontextum]